MRKFLIISALLFIGVCLLFRMAKWDGKTRVTMIYLNSPIRVESFDPQTQEGIKLILPDNLEIDSWQVKSLPTAAKKNGAKWGNDLIADYLGIFYTTNVSWFDKLRFWYASKDITWKEIDLGDTRFVSTHKAPDGVEIATLTSAWDTQAQKLFVSQNIANEDLRATLINTLEKPGLGAHLARPLENIGLKVSQIKSEGPAISGCKIVGSQKFRGVEVILRNWNCQWEKDTNSGHDLTIFLGQF